MTLKEEYEVQRQAEFQDVHCKDIANAADCALEGSSQVRGESLSGALFINSVFHQTVDYVVRRLCT